MPTTKEKELHDAAFKAAQVWDRQSGRVFESMGEDSPRALAIREAMEALKDALVEFEKAVPWHPASSPPDNDRRVLVFVPELNEPTDKGMRDGWFKDGEWEVPGGYDKPATHWRELPEGPKEGV